MKPKTVEKPARQTRGRSLPGLEIRPAKLADLPFVLRNIEGLMRHEVAQRFDTTLHVTSPRSEAYAAGIRKAIRSSSCCILVAEWDGEPVGHLRGVIQEMNFRRDPRLGEVITVFVDARHRRKGIGKAMLQRFFEWCRDHGVKRARIVASTPNRDALRLYGNVGFTAFETILERDL